MLISFQAKIIYIHLYSPIWQIQSKRRNNSGKT